MKHISLIAPQGQFSVTNLDLSRQLFSWVNEQAPFPLFQIDIVGVAAEAKPVGDIYTVKTDRLIEEVTHTDVVLIPAIFGEPEQVLADNQALAPWIMRQYEQGADLVSMCMGAFFLASLGLLDDKRCSTHWAAANDFRLLYPGAILEDERIVAESSRIYTSGGALAFTNLIIYLIERYAGRPWAVATAKAFMIDIDRKSQSAFAIFTGQKGHGDEMVLKAQEYIEANFAEKLTVEELCEQVGLGRRTFERRFKQATSNTVVEYMQRVKMEAAKQQLELGHQSVSEAMFEVGYNDTKAFRDVFKRWVGMTPTEYRKKYSPQQMIMG